MTASLGEWQDDRPSNHTATPPGARSAPQTAIASLDIGAYVQDAVAAALRKRLQTLAAAALDTVLDDPALAQLCEDADAAARDALQQPSADSAAAQTPPPELYFPDLLAFVRDYLGPMYRRSLSAPGVTWCAQWWKHSEAIARLEALWRAWEYLRQDPHTGISVWFRDHADHHMAILLNADGPFKGCKPQAHGERLTPLPLTAPPDGHATLR